MAHKHSKLVSVTLSILRGSRYSYGIMVQPLRIEVVGESTIHRPAERAVVSITVQSEGSSQEEVARNVSSTTSQLREMLERLATKDASGGSPLLARLDLSKLMDSRTSDRRRSSIKVV